MLAKKTKDKANLSRALTLPQSTRKLPSYEHPTYVLISPVYNEEQFIGPMIESIVAQTVLPKPWVIVNDGSTDKTAAIIQSYARRYPFIELINLPQHATREPGGEGAVQLAFHLAQAWPHDFLARFDADLEFSPDYIERILFEFAKDETLGIAGGGLYVERNGSLELEKVPHYHVRGGVKMYRRKCLEQIGILSTTMGWDTIDEIYAWKHGWRTRSFFDNRVIHKRPTGNGLSLKEISWQRGKGEYLTWSHPLFVSLKSVKVAATSPTRAIYYVGGFLDCYLKSEKRLQDPTFRRIRRRQQLKRMLTLGISAGK